MASASASPSPAAARPVWPGANPDDAPDWLVRLLRRDGPNCHLCGFPLSLAPTTDGRTGLYPTRDHLVPCRYLYDDRKGRFCRAPGREDLRKLRLAHSACNERRGRQPLTPELKQQITAWVVRRFGAELTRSTYPAAHLLRALAGPQFPSFPVPRQVEEATR